MREGRDIGETVMGKGTNQVEMVNRFSLLRTRSLPRGLYMVRCKALNERKLNAVDACSWRPQLGI